MNDFFLIVLGSFCISFVLTSCNTDNNSVFTDADALPDTDLDAGDTNSNTCQPTAVWGTSFEEGEPVGNFALNGLFDSDADGAIDTDVADFNLEDVFCHGYKSVVLIASNFS